VSQEENHVMNGILESWYEFSGVVSYMRKADWKCYSFWEGKIWIFMAVGKRQKKDLALLETVNRKEVYERYEF